MLVSIPIAINASNCSRVKLKIQHQNLIFQVQISDYSREILWSFEFFNVDFSVNAHEPTISELRFISSLRIILYRHGSLKICLYVVRLTVRVRRVYYLSEYGRRTIKSSETVKLFNYRRARANHFRIIDELKAPKFSSSRNSFETK